MVVIVDANILLSAISNFKKTLFNLITEVSPSIDFVVPEFVFNEIKNNEQKVSISTKSSVEKMRQNLSLLLQHILIIKDDDVVESYFKKAYEITYSIDSNDTIYVAFAISLDALLWTGDLKLYRGLRRKGFTNIVTTAQLKEIIKGIK